MEYRQLGRTGLKVSDIGYGAWGIGGPGGGWVGAKDDESLQALERFIELGGTFIDTARGYGRSEELVGRVLREHAGEGLIVATKVPPKNGQWPARSGVAVEDAFPGDHIRASVEESLAASGLGGRLPCAHDRSRCCRSESRGAGEQRAPGRTGGHPDRKSVV